MIPLAKDTRAAIGQFADKVENRSLLFNKMALAKNWGHPARFNDANRFNVLRACTAGGELLSEDAESARRKAGSQNAQEHIRNEAAYRAEVAGALAGVKVTNAAPKASTAVRSPLAHALLRSAALSCPSELAGLPPSSGLEF